MDCMFYLEKPWLPRLIVWFWTMRFQHCPRLEPLVFHVISFSSIPNCFSNHSSALSFSSRMMVQQLQEPVPRGAPLAELLHSVQGANLGKKGDSMRIEIPCLNIRKIEPYVQQRCCSHCSHRSSIWTVNFPWLMVVRNSEQNQNMGFKMDLTLRPSKDAWFDHQNKCWVTRQVVCCNLKQRVLSWLHGLGTSWKKGKAMCAKMRISAGFFKFWCPFRPLSVTDCSSTDGQILQLPGVKEPGTKLWGEAKWTFKSPCSSFQPRNWEASEGWKKSLTADCEVPWSKSCLHRVPNLMSLTIGEFP